MKPYELQVVKEDLEYLQTVWIGTIADPEIRRGSAVLRRLLVDGVYGRAWRSLGFPAQPKIIAVDLNNIVGRTPMANIKLALAGGVRLSGVLSAGIFIAISPHPPSETPPLTEDGFPGEREFTVSEYLASNAGVVGRQTATRRDVIKYFANVKGGVHLGSSKSHDEAKLIARMQKFEKRVSVFEKDGLLVELLAIGQALARAPNTKTFIKLAGIPAERLETEQAQRNST